MAGAASAPPLLYAPFARRLAALALDGLIVAALFGALVVVVDAIAGAPLLVEIWRAPRPVAVTSETASRTVAKEEGGAVRELTTRRETRVYPDGTVRVYAVLDARITGADGVPAVSSTERLIGMSAVAWHRRLATALAGVALALLYFALFEASALQGSPGKRALGLRVTDLAGRRLGPGRAAARQLFKCLDLASSGVTYLIAGLTERNQGLHDILAGTLVLRTVSPQPATFGATTTSPSPACGRGPG
ncbi:MAG TPA: RDD family protein [Alphaproteobacteria bacterium]|nr:RDD family protein [Alphaproteobacteria bacterium]